MSVPEQVPYKEYLATGSNNSFEITFYLPDPKDLVVMVNKEIPLVGAYSVQGNTVVFNTAPNEGDLVELTRDTQLDRETEYKSYDNSFRPETINFDLDKIWLVLQESNLVDAKILARLKAEIEWRRTHDFNYDELAQAREKQLFDALKGYSETLLASTNPGVFQGVIAGVVFAQDGKSVQTHLKEIADKFAEERQYLEEQLNTKAEASDVYPKSQTYTQMEVNNLVDPKADQTYVDEAIGAISTDANKQYATLAAANADIVNIPVGQVVFISEATNGGYWYKELVGSTSLTKSAFDPLTQAKEYADLKIAIAGVPSWVNSHTGVLPLLDVDLINNRVWTPTKIGSLSDFFIQNVDGSYTIKQMPDGLNGGYSIVCKIKAPGKTETISGTAFSIITTGSNNSESYLQIKNATLNRAVSAVFGGRGSASSLATKSIYGNDIYALTRDANAVKYYVENNKESEQASSVTDSTYLKPTNFAIGKSLYPSSPANATKFIIERVTIYDNALNSNTVNSLMTNLSELKKPTTPILEYPSWLMKVKAADGSIKVPSFQFNEKTKQCWFNGTVRNIDDVAPLVSTGVRVFKTRPYGLDVNKGYTLLNDVSLPFTWTHASNPITGYAICASESTNNVRLRAHQTVLSNTGVKDGSFEFNGYIQSVGDMVPRSSANRPSSIGGAGPTYHRGRGIYRGSASVPATGPLLTGLNGRPVLVTSRSATQQTDYPDYWVLGGDSNLTNKVTNCEVISTVIFSEALTQDELQQAQCFTPENYPILFFMGDSFNNLSQTSDATLAHLAKSGLGYIPVMHDGQGGKGLNYQRDLINGWLDAYPYLKKSILVINEGGFDTISDTPTSTVVQGPFSQRDIINFIDEMVERFDDKRLIYMHCQTNSGYTEDIKAFMANIKRTYPDAFCDATGLLQSAFPTDAEYEAAILTGATPSFLRSDDVHISWGNLVKSESGYYYWGLAIARKLKQLLINSN